MSSSSPFARRKIEPATDAVQSSITSPSSAATLAQAPVADPPKPIAPAPTSAEASSLPTPTTPTSSRKRKQPGSTGPSDTPSNVKIEVGEADTPLAGQPAAKRSRTNTPWTPAEEQRLKRMRDDGKSWSEIAKDMHYAEFAEDESAALLAAIKEYEASKWKVIGQKVGKPAKACEQYAKENFGGKL
ncbi:MAG: hypothetical protein M1814_004368 [Vezdaea aestivalis]|nr:MAG: hypothetical protein M1814_004368 [Vezdaea aestivalis]